VHFGVHVTLRDTLHLRPLDLDGRHVRRLTVERHLYRATGYLDYSCGANVLAIPHQHPVTRIQKFAYRG
jgi:hypothetical protein